MPKSNAQKGERQKERFTLRIDWVLASIVDAICKPNNLPSRSIVSVFEEALEMYFVLHQKLYTTLPRTYIMAKVTFIYSSGMTASEPVEFIFNIFTKEWETKDPNSSFKSNKFKGLKSLPKEVIYS